MVCVVLFTFKKKIMIIYEGTYDYEQKKKPNLTTWVVSYEYENK